MLTQSRRTVLKTSAACIQAALLLLVFPFDLYAAKGKAKGTDDDESLGSPRK